MKRMIHRVVTSLNYDIVDERKLVSENRDISMIQKSSKKSSKSSPSEISEVSNATNSQVYLLMKLAQSIRDLSLNMGTDIIPEISSHNNGDHIIPTYYMNEKNTKGKLLDIDFGWTIIDSIRNLRALTPYQL